MRRKCLLESNEVRPFEVAGPMMKVQPVLNMVAKLSQPLRVRLGSIRLAGISLKRQTRQWNLLPNPSCHPVGETVGRLSLLPILCRTTVRMIQVRGASDVPYGGGQSPRYAPDPTPAPASEPEPYGTYSRSQQSPSDS